MSFKLNLSRRDRIAARFLAQVHSALSSAFVQAKKDDQLTQRALSSALDVDKAVISRILSGAGNPTARTIAELADAMGYRPELKLHKIAIEAGANHVPRRIAVAGTDNVTGYEMVSRNASAASQKVIVWPKQYSGLETRQ